MAFALPTIDDGNRRWWTLGAMCFALFMIMLDNTVVNVALPSIQRDLDASISGLEWTVNAYTLTFAVLLVTGGRLGDIFGRRLGFLVGVTIFGLSSLFIVFSQSAEWLIAGRAMQGVGAAFMMPATLSIITNAFPAHERGKAIGTWAGVSALALAIGPVVGGFLVEHVSWQSIFLINVPVAVLAVVVALWATHESRDETAPRIVDFPGLLTLTAGLTALVLALVEGNSWGWGSPQIIALLTFAVASLLAFVVIERRTEFPMVDFSTFRSRSFLGTNIVAFIVSFSMLAVFFFIALYMQNVLDYSPLEAGVRFLPTTAVIIVVGPIAGRLSDRIGPRPLMVTGLVLVSAALYLQSFLKVDTSYTSLIVPFTVLGIGIGLVMAPMSTAAMNAVPANKAGVASGVLSMFRMIGGTFGVAATGALISVIGSSKIESALPSASPEQVDHLTEAIGGGGQGLAAQQAAAVQNAFLDALNTSLKLAALVALIGAVVAWWLIADRAERPDEQPVVEAESTPLPEPAREPIHA